MQADISVHQWSKFRWTAHLNSLDGTGFVITPVYSGFTRDRAYDKAVKDAKKIAARWANDEKIRVEL